MLMQIKQAFNLDDNEPSEEQTQKLRFLFGEIDYEELKESGISYYDFSEDELDLFAQYAVGLERLYTEDLISKESYNAEWERLGGKGFLYDYSFGNIASDPKGNAALALTLMAMNPATYKAGAAAEEVILNVGIKAYTVGQRAWNNVKGLINKVSSRFITKIPIDKLKMNPEDPFNYAKQNYNSQALSNYRNYIARYGTIPEPIIVSKVGDAYMILDGHHRYWAAIQMGLKEIPIKVLNK